VKWKVTGIDDVPDLLLLLLLLLLEMAMLKAGTRLTSKRAEAAEHVGGADASALQHS
jgi:hypothetical protein